MNNWGPRGYNGGGGSTMREEKNPIETGRNTTGGSSRGEILLAVESLKGMEGGA